MLEEFNTQVV